LEGKGLNREPRLVVVGSTVLDLGADADPLLGRGVTVVGRGFQLDESNSVRQTTGKE